MERGPTYLNHHIYNNYNFKDVSNESVETHCIHFIFIPIIISMTHNIIIYLRVRKEQRILISLNITLFFFIISSHYFSTYRNIINKVNNTFLKCNISHYLHFKKILGYVHEIFIWYFFYSKLFPPTQKDRHSHNETLCAIGPFCFAIREYRFAPAWERWSQRATFRSLRPKSP